LGCTAEGNILTHCAKCSIVHCPEKGGDPAKPCGACSKYPCKRLKSLEKRFITNYGESLMDNFRQIAEKGLEQFLLEAEEAWRCQECGNMLSVHRAQCLHCKASNEHYKRERK
jgi:hypothetical protein